MSDELKNALQTVHDRYTAYLDAFGPEENYLKKKVETELGTKMIHLKMRCSGLGSEWGKVRKFRYVIWQRTVHTFVLINEIDHLVSFTMFSFLFYDRFLCWEPLVYQGHMSSKEHKFGCNCKLPLV